MGKYNVVYLDKNNKHIFKKGTMGGGGSQITASNPNIAIKNAESEIGNFPNTVKIQLFKDSRKTSVRYGTWNISKQKWEVPEHKLIEKYLGERETKWDLYANGKKANKKPMSKKEMEDMEEKLNKMGRKTRSEIVEAKSWGGAMAKKHSSSTQMQCNECGKRFKKNIGKNTFEVKCPKCGSYDTEPA